MPAPLSGLLDHVSFGVSDLARSRAFYDAVFAPLGVVRVWDAPDAAGYGYPGCDDSFAIKQSADVPGLRGRSESPDVLGSSARSHLAFAAPSRDAVIAFHAAGMTLGAVDEGGPALCSEYGPGYFAAFLRDPDGYRLEAVLHEPV